MSYVLVRSIRVDLDVQDYLESKGLHKVRLVGDNVMACCPFHDERSPSFGVNVDTGVYNCFGCGAKGSIGHLVKTLDKYDTVYDAESHLIRNFGRYSVDVHDDLALDFGDDVEHSNYHVNENVLKQYLFRHPYLRERGIDEAWQRRFGIGYSKQHRAITIPWYDERNRLITVKFRSITGKQFWYDPPLPAGLKAETLWGLNTFLHSGLTRLALTEAEIDGLSVWQAGAERGIGAAGIGGNQFNRSQADKLIRLLPESTEIIVCTDNDEGGALAKERISELLAGRLRLSEIDWRLIGRNVKDANDLSTSELVYLLDNRKPMGIKLFF